MRNEDSEIPVIQLTYQFTADVLANLHTFPKCHQPTLGDSLNRKLITLLDKLITTNALRDPVKKTESIRSLIAELLSIRLKIRLARDLRCISKGRYADLNMKLDDIQRQLTGWYNWSKNSLEKKNKSH